MAERQRMKFKYAASAIDRIHQMGASSISEFVGEISQQALSRAVSALPDIRGFRPNSRPGVHRQIQNLAKRLTGDRSLNPENTGRDIEVLGAIWVSWGIEKLGDASAINNYIKRSQRNSRYEYGEGQADDEELLAVELFEKLRDVSRSNGCAREDIRRFFDFSPFGEAEHLRDIIESCKTAAEVAHDRNISGLPRRVERVEQDISAFLKRINALSKDSEEHAKNLSRLCEDVITLQQVASNTNETVLEMHKRIEAVLSDVELQKGQVTKEIKDQGSLVHSAAASIEQLQIEFVTVSNRLNQLAEGSGKSTEAIMDVNAEVEQIRKLITKLSAAANRTLTTERSLDTRPKDEITETRPTRTVALERLRKVDGQVEPTVLGGKDEFIGAVSRNFEALNIKRSSAEALAIECIAAFMAGQMPYFAGLNGQRVAEACAMALAADEVHVLTVPVGVSAPHDFRHQLKALFCNERQDISCIIVEGINRSALDTFGESLIELNSRQWSGDPTSRAMLIMATLTEGPASLPLSMAHVSLGPVFFTDSLDWRSRPRTTATRIEGLVSLEVWIGACESAWQSAADTDEALRLLDKFAPAANPLLRRVVLSGFRVLSALRSDRPGPTPLQSLAFGWLAPVCIAVGASAQIADEELDRGQVDGEAPDERLANLLRTGRLGDQQKERV